MGLGRGIEYPNKSEGAIEGVEWPRSLSSRSPYSHYLDSPVNPTPLFLLASTGSGWGCE